MSGVNEELSLWDNIKNAQVFIQWVVVLIVMGVISIVIKNAYGELNSNFFCIDIGDSFVTPDRLLVLFTLLVFGVIVGVREWTKKVDYDGTTQEERKEEFKDFIVYIIIVLASFVYATAYIRRKFSKGGQSGGGNTGILGDSVDKVKSLNIGTLTLYIGILVVILNIFSNTYQYLKNRKRNQKDKLLRAIYFAQIATLFIGIVASFFVAGFGCSIIKENSNLKTIGKAFTKWAIVIAGSGVGIHLINLSTGGENWFGELKEKEIEDEQTIHASE
tara:strand:+ start:373 stop:1194 length:822 start_codon:yes stop_codon:yes gene_type:complete